MITTLPVNCLQCGLLFNKPLAYIKHGINRGYTNHFCSNKCSTLYAKSKQVEYKEKRIREYNENPRCCKYCQSPISYELKNEQSYCSRSCAAKENNKKRDWKSEWPEERRKYFSDIAKKNQPRTKRKCLNCGKDFEAYPKSKRKCCSHKCASEWVKNTGYLKGKCGGYREKGGRGKQGWYNGYYCNSSWELAWIIYQLEHDIIPERNKEGFPYSFNNQQKKYYPDFKIGNEYYEIKGYHSKQVDAKIKQFPHKLTILHKQDLTEVFDYVIDKYGKDFIKLYVTNEF